MLYSEGDRGQGLLGAARGGYFHRCISPSVRNSSNNPLDNPFRVLACKAIQVKYAIHAYALVSILEGSTFAVKLNMSYVYDGFQKIISVDTR